MTPEPAAVLAAQQIVEYCMEENAHDEAVEAVVRILATYAAAQREDALAGHGHEQCVDKAQANQHLGRIQEEFQGAIADLRAQLAATNDRIQQTEASWRSLDAGWQERYDALQAALAQARAMHAQPAIGHAQCTTCLAALPAAQAGAGQ